MTYRGRTTSASPPLTPRGRGGEQEVNPIDIRVRLLFKWIGLSLIIIVLWEHFATILKFEWTPIYLINLVTDHIAEPLFNWLGAWWAYLSGYVEILHLTELLQTVWNILHAVGYLILSCRQFVVGYYEVIIEYEWTPSTIIGSSVSLLILVCILVYTFRERLYNIGMRISDSRVRQNIVTSSPLSPSNATTNVSSTTITTTNQ